MKHARFAITAALLGLIAFGCSEQPLDTTQGPSKLGPSFSAMSGTETLNDIDIALAAGTGMVVSGVGLKGDPAVVQPGTININVPGAVMQVLLYWEGHNDGSGGDNQILVNGAPVTGDLIGGPTLFFMTAYSSTYRADITSLGLIGPGANSLQISGMGFTFACPDDCRNNGVGILVIYDDGSGVKEMGLKDGNDLAFYEFTSPLDTTVPQTFNFTAASTDRAGNLVVLSGSVAADRPNIIRVSSGGTTSDYVDLLFSNEGPEFDAIEFTVNIPAGATSLTVQLLSEKAPSSTFGGIPASLCWIAGGLTITPEEQQPEGCRVTGGGVDDSGNWDGTFANGNSNTDTYTCGGQAGAPTALQPQPWGEWTHSNHKGPAGSFTFHAGTASAPEGTEIDWIECMDPQNCDPARPAPAKQIDFWGVGVFKNMKPNVPASIADNVEVGVSLHWFEVNIDDLGEPGRSGRQDPPSSECPTDGYGRNATEQFANCDCPDFYRIKIYAGPTNASPVIYEVSGYIRGGNFQIHPLTGHDLN